MNIASSKEPFIFADHAIRVFQKNEVFLFIFLFFLIINNKKPDGKLFLWTFVMKNQFDTGIFHKNLTAFIFENFFQMKAQIFFEKTHPMQRFRTSEYKIYSFYSTLLTRISMIFNETLPISVKNNKFMLFF